MAQVQYTLIGARLTKAKKSNERAEVRKTWCENPSLCSLFKRGFCLLPEIFGRCEYGHESITVSGSTKRGKDYNVFITNETAKFKTGEYSKPPQGAYKYCIQLIRDYYYLPYAQMNHKDGQSKIPFVEHSNFMISGSRFMPKSAFTPEVICEIVKFRPIAIMGGEIKSYQKEEVPKFLFHLKYLFPGLFKASVKIMPEIENKVLNLDSFDKIDATMADIPKGCTEGYTLGKEIKPVNWDGETLVCKGDARAFYMTFCNITPEGEVTLSFKPNKEKTKVTVINKDLKEKMCETNPELVK